MSDLGNPDASGLTRRRLIEVGATGALGLTGAGWLAGCGGAKEKLSSTATPDGDAKPKRGGALVVSMITGGSTETLVPGLAVTEPDIARSELLFDPLFRLDPDLGAAPAVAQSAEPNADGTVWTVKVRDGVVWHDGRPVTADDIVYSINAWTDEKQNYTAATMARVIDVKGVRKRDARTVEIPMNLPVGDFPILTAFYGFAVLPDGATPKDILEKPVGTGAWKFKSFKPGARSVFTANKDYWVHDGPYIDELTIDSSFTEESARLNSLLSGQSQVMQAMPFALARREKDAKPDQAARGDRHLVPVLRDADRRRAAARRAGAAGAAAADGPPGVRRPDPQRLRRGGGRSAVPRGEVLRRGVQARAGRRPGQVAAEGGRPGEPERAARHLQRARRARRRLDAVPAAGQAGRRPGEDQPDRSRDVLQRHARPLVELPVLGHLLGQRHRLARAVLPQRAVEGRSVQRDRLEGSGRRQAADGRDRHGRRGQGDGEVERGAAPAVRGRWLSGVREPDLRGRSGEGGQRARTVEVGLAQRVRAAQRVALLRRPSWGRRSRRRIPATAPCGRR